MHQWDWHAFEDETKVVEVDEDDYYSSFEAQTTPDFYITRSFYVGKLDDGYHYTIGFQQVTRPELLWGLLGEDFKYNDQTLEVPESGAWMVNFNVTGSGNNYAPVELSQRARKDLFNAVSCAVYDHYNVAKAGIYCWHAASENLVELYDRALGFTEEPDIKQKFIPKSEKFKSLVGGGRGYAIITKYY